MWYTGVCDWRQEGHSTTFAGIVDEDNLGDELARRPHDNTPKHPDQRRPCLIVEHTHDAHWRQYAYVVRLLLAAAATNTHTYNGTTWVSRYQKVKPIWILLKQETVSGSGISWATCKSAPRSRQITTPDNHSKFFYRPDALPAAQPTASNHWRQ